MNTTTARLQTHVSIDTADLAASVSFYRALLDAEPALERHDYARFDVSEPPLVLGLNAVARLEPGPTGALEHLGVRFEDESGLDAVRRRLQGLAVSIDEEPDTECCYSRLARAWATDPSGVHWELFVAKEAVVEAPSRAGNASSCCAPSCCATLES
jgi:catechol 2,3-dioxygenase-like lactoylglutathione lyase family enzyme